MIAGKLVAKGILRNGKRIVAGGACSFV